MEEKPDKSRQKAVGLLKLRRAVNRPRLLRLKPQYARRDAVKRQKRNLLRHKFNEDKRVTQAFASAATRYTTAGTFTLLNGVASGFDADNRIGRRIHMHKVHYTTFWNGIAGSDHDARIVVFYDKAPNGAAPTTALLFEQTTTPWASAFNKDTEWRFEILSDTMGAVDSAGYGIGAQDVCIELDHYVTYTSGTGATITAIQSGALYLYLVSGRNAMSDSGSVTMYYTDV